MPEGDADISIMNTRPLNRDPIADFNPAQIDELRGAGFTEDWIPKDVLNLKSSEPVVDAHQQETKPEVATAADGLDTPKQTKILAEQTI